MDIFTEQSMTPVLKWAGGKTQLLGAITSSLPPEYNSYYEPFVGGGAVILNIAPRKAFINDINEQLINLYTQLKHSVNNVIATVNELDAIYCDKEKYYEIRERYNNKILNHELDEECAALMIWINKHCFNGLYRVNSKGLFNVPYNNKNGNRSIVESNLLRISGYLREADITISCRDFEEFCENVKAGDFVYFDSPYIPESETANFTDYTQDGFTLKDHERLAALFRRLDAAGVHLMLSNNDVPLVKTLYQGYNIRSVAAKRNINRNADKRTGQEVIITNY